MADLRDRGALRREVTVRPRNDKGKDRTFAPAYALSGPDATSRVAVIEWDIVTGVYRLKTLGRDGKDERLLEERKRDGNDVPYGDAIALSLDGKRVAFLRSPSGIQMRNPE